MTDNRFQAGCYRTMDLIFKEQNEKILDQIWQELNKKHGVSIRNNLDFKEKLNLINEHEMCIIKEINNNWSFGE